MLLLDLQYLIYLIAQINEIDAAKKYIDKIYELYLYSLNETDKDFLYESMFSDLTGMRKQYKSKNYKSGELIAYQPVQILYWIFNKYYAEHLDHNKLSKIQEIVCSYEFWENVKKRLSNKESFMYSRLDTKKFQGVVKAMFSLDLSDDVIKVIREVNAELSKTANENCRESNHKSDVDAI